MISRLPSIPGYAFVRRTDWTISIAFRSCRARSAAGAGRRRVRTSCIVTVDAPRCRPSRLSMAAEHDPERVEPRVVPERLVLDRGGCVDELGRDLVKGYQIAAIAPQRRKQDLAGAIVDGRLLLEVDCLQRVGRLRQARGDRPEDREGDAGRERAGHEERDHEHAGDGGKTQPRGSMPVGSVSRPTAPLPSSTRLAWPVGSRRPARGTSLDLVVSTPGSSQGGHPAPRACALQWGTADADEGCGDRHRASREAAASPGYAGVAAATGGQFGGVPPSTWRSARIVA